MPRMAFGQELAVDHSAAAPDHCRPTVPLGDNSGFFTKEGRPAIIYHGQGSGRNQLAFGIELLGDEQGKEGMVIAAGAGKKTLQVGHIQPPFELKEGEDLKLRVFIDKNLVEVFANDRQAAMVAHKHIRANPNLRLFSTGGELRARAKAWRMKSVYPKR